MAFKTDDQRKAVMAKMNQDNKRDTSPKFSQQSNKPTGFLARLKEARRKKAEANEIQRQKEEERELVEIQKLEKQAEVETSREERETKIQTLKEEAIERRRKTKERLIQLRRERFSRSATGKLLAVGKKVAVKLSEKPKRKKKK